MRAEARALANVSADALEKMDQKSKRKLVENVTPDPFDREVEVMAKLKAYYHIAGTRFVDTVYMIVEAGFLHGLHGLNDVIKQELGLMESRGKFRHGH